MRIERANQTNLYNLLGWLEREYRQFSQGFWVNRNLICGAMQNDELWIIEEAGEVVAFQVGTYSPEIVCVRADSNGKASVQRWLKLLSSARGGITSMYSPANAPRGRHCPSG